MLAGLGVDRVVNYKKERLKEVLRSEYRRGVDLAYESVGGEMFETAVDALAPHGVLIVIGMMSQYTSGGDDASEAWTPSENKGLPEKLLWKSASVRGFFLPQYAKHFRRHLAGLFELVRSGKMRVEIDPTPFKGLEAVPRAVAHLQGGTSMGKVVVGVRPAERRGCESFNTIFHRHLSPSPARSSTRARPASWTRCCRRGTKCALGGELAEQVLGPSGRSR